MARARDRHSGIGTATPCTGMDHTRPRVIHTGCVVSVGHRPALGQATSGSTTGMQTEGRPLYLPARQFTEATVLPALQARRSEDWRAGSAKFSSARQFGQRLLPLPRRRDTRGGPCHWKAFLNTFQVAIESRLTPRNNQDQQLN